jgi:hypothetical protein
MIPYYVIFFFPQKGKGGRKKEKKIWEKKGFSPISFEEIFFPPSLFGERKI